MTTPTTISATTKLSKALELHTDVLEYIISLDPHDFDRLRNPVMRKLMGPRISLGRIAMMTGMNVNALLEQIAILSGAKVEPSTDEILNTPSSSERPAWVADATRTVNLLPMDELLTEDPMLPVMLEVKKLKPGEVLLIRHKWEPQPFYDIWAKMPGLEWFAESVSADEWQIWVRRQ
jgi:Domain of unknown function (DUF1858)